MWGDFKIYVNSENDCFKERLEAIIWFQLVVENCVEVEVEAVFMLPQSV